MRIDSGEISGRQLMFSVACFFQSSSLLTSFLVGVTLQDSWFTVLLGFILCLPLMWMYSTLMSRFPGKNLIQILEEIFGKIGGKIIGAVYVWFFLTLSSLNVMDLGDFTTLTIMEETPIIILVIMCILVSAIAVRHGVTLVTKYGTLFVMVCTVIMILSLLLILNLCNPDNFLPAFTMPPIKYVQSTHLIITIPFGEFVVFLMLNPNINLSKKDIKKYIFIGYIWGALTLLLVIARDIAVLGNTLGLFTLPPLVTLRLVNFGPSLGRVEIMFAIVLVMLLFFKVTILYYLTVQAIAQLFGVKDYKRLVLAAGALIILYGTTLYPNPSEHAASAHEVIPFIWTVFEILIPLLILLVSGIKASKKKEA